MLAVLPWLAWPAHCARASGHGDAGLRVATQGSGLVGLDGRLGISALVDATYGPRHSGVGVSWGVAAMTGAGDDNSRTYGVLGLTGAVDPFGDHRVETLLRFGAWAGAVVGGLDFGGWAAGAVRGGWELQPGVRLGPVVEGWFFVGGDPLVLIVPGAFLAW